jgi:hypothetical protein
MIIQYHFRLLSISLVFIDDKSAISFNERSDEVCVSADENIVFRYSLETLIFRVFALQTILHLV